MKKILSIIFLAILTFSCEKDDLVPGEELPDWLIDLIELQEQAVADNSKCEYARSSWIRYQWNSEYYYEYWNMASSFFPSPISHTRDTLDISQGDANTDYSKEKCCGVYAWKGPSFIDHLD
jgi:hypothetical protein